MMPQQPISTSNLPIWNSHDQDLRMTSNLHHDLQTAMQARRSLTLQLFEDLDPQTFRQQAHSDFSPVGWHLGHIGYTEAKWVLQHMAHLPMPWPQYHKLFAADGLPKHERQNLPEYSEIVDYLQVIRSQVFDYLQQAQVLEEQRLWQFLLQHESHTEIITVAILP